jgi:8-oxo-dGTP pyrophosphatase MutT (NUDIX family)
MADQPLFVTNIDGSRSFWCAPVALIAFIVNEQEEFLLLSSPAKRKPEIGWETVSGSLEAGETVLAGALREIREEIGEEVQVRPLGMVHAYTFHYDDKVRDMVGLCFLMEYKGGRIIPGSDIHGSQYRWWRLEELENHRSKIFPPANRGWLLRRVIELYRLWRTHDVDPRQLGVEPMD